MRLRRCHALVIEPRESRSVDLDALIAGEARMASRIQWVAMAAHLDEGVALDDVHVQALGRISPTEWTGRNMLDETFGTLAIDRLIDARLVMREGGTHAGDDALRESHWHPLAASLHRQLRWRSVDTRITATETDRDAPTMLDRLGMPPALVAERCPADQRIVLNEPSPGSPLDTLASLRVTCRNFDPHRAIDALTFSTLLHRVHRARALSDVSGIAVQKKSVPSAGGLHPIEAYLLVRRVDGVTPGLYHYHALDHALEPIRRLTDDESETHAHDFVARQPWFVDAPLQIILAARFRRNFWKYRGHAKAYRAIILDAGHLSQMQYLVATELGLGAFITAAVNEGEIEDAFGLDPMESGVLAVTGVGHRAVAMAEFEFDPLQSVWPAP